MAKRGERSVAGNTAREWCEKYPHHSSKSIARALHELFPELFHSFDHAYNHVRYARGERKGRGAYTSEPVRKLPPPDREKGKHPDYLFPDVKRPLWGAIFTDLHIPYHDPDAIEIAMEYCAEQEHTDFLILGGDFIDCHALSYWEKDPRARSLAGEIEKAKEILDALRKTFKRIIYKEGNHENRLTRYIWQHAPALVGLEGVDLPTLLGLKERKIAWVHEASAIISPRLTIIHGHEFGGFVSNPVNPARGLFMRAKANAICGHFHQTSHHSEGTVEADVISCWSVGCLCNLRPLYRPMAFTKWNHGFARLAFEGEKFWVRNHEIADGKVF